VTTDDQGVARIAAVSASEQSVTVSAAGYATQIGTLPAPGEPPLLEIALPARQPAGQLRFLVRDHENGEPLVANIHVRPADAQVEPNVYKASADGRFEIDLAPGRYLVEVKLYGWRKQVKTVEIEDESVTLIDAALHPRSHSRHKRKR
jgi:hypothetical protein